MLNFTENTDICFRGLFTATQHCIVRRTVAQSAMGPHLPTLVLMHILAFHVSSHRSYICRCSNVVDLSRRPLLLLSGRVSGLIISATSTTTAPCDWNMEVCRCIYSLSGTRWAQSTEDGRSRTNVQFCTSRMRACRPFQPPARLLFSILRSQSRISRRSSLG